ncbi:MAG TPA: hypothetical protein VF230_15265 [Acidimicrobiales bacterium]
MAAFGGARPIDHLREVCALGRAQTSGRAPRGIRHDDADAEVGTFASDDAIGFDPFPMLAVMQTTGADYAVFGQVAGILHGSSDPTGDLDILWDGSADAIDAMAHAFEAAGVVLRDEEFDRVEAANYQAALAGAKVYFEGLHCAGDLCTPRLPWGSLDVEAFLGRKVWAHGDLLAVPYLCREDLLTMRMAVTGPKHARRARELERLAREGWQGHDTASG